MAEFVSFFPIFYLIPIVFLYIFVGYFYLPKPVGLIFVGLLYLAWSIVLGVRNVYDDLYFDPGFYHYQAKTFTAIEIWNNNFPTKIDILLQIIMRAYFKIFEDDTCVLFFAEATIIGLLFMGLLVLTKANINSLIIGISFLVFTNTGILLVGNFLRQGLASAIFLNIFCFVTSCKYDYTAKITRFKFFSLSYLSLFQFFAHISSISLLFYLLIADFFKKRELKKAKFWFITISITSLVLVADSVFFSESEVYGGYITAEYDEGSAKLMIKLVIDCLALIALFVVNRYFLNSKSETLNLAIKTCILIFLICCFYFSSPVAALRMEYYLNFLIVVTLSLFISYFPSTTIVARVTTLLSVLAMYSYSFTVYQHPSIIKMFIY